MGIQRHLKRPHAFTLLELLVVMGIISLLLVVLVPAVNSLSKSSGRKAAVGGLLGAIEQARAQAIKDGQATYLVFPDQLPPGADNPTRQKYAYRSYAVFEDDPKNPGTQNQLTPWHTLPTGISIHKDSLSFLANNISFQFTPIGPNTSAKFPYLKFNPSGEVDPTTTPTSTTGTIPFKIFEGSVDSNGVHFTSSSSFTENIEVVRLTGRAKRM